MQHNDLIFFIVAITKFIRDTPDQLEAFLHVSKLLKPSECKA